MQELDGNISIQMQICQRENRKDAHWVIEGSVIEAYASMLMDDLEWSIIDSTLKNPVQACFTRH